MYWMMVWETCGFCLQPENKKQWNHSLHLFERKFWRIVDGSSATLAYLLECALHLVCLFCSVVPCMIFLSGNILLFLLSLHSGSEPVYAVIPFSVSDKNGLAFLQYWSHYDGHMQNRSTWTRQRQLYGCIYQLLYLSASKHEQTILTFRFNGIMHFIRWKLIPVEIFTEWGHRNV
jgi:hypothetical protein